VLVIQLLVKDVTNCPIHPNTLRGCMRELLGARYFVKSTFHVDL